MASAKSSEIIELDRLDRQIIHALLVSPRAAFSHLADVLGSSEQTVARRYRRLVEARVVRVRGLRGPVAGVQDWMVRAQVRAGSAGPVAGALAAREDVSWVVIAAGGAEVVCSTRPRSAEQRDALLLERLPGASQVTALSAHAILHRYAGSGAKEWSAFDDPLEPAQVRALEAERGPRPDGVVSNPQPQPAPLEPGDEALAAALHEDGRASIAALAAAGGDSPGRVRRRLDLLLGTGSLYVDIEVATGPLGLDVAAILWLAIAPAHLVESAERMASAPESAFVAAVSGAQNLYVSLVCRDTAALYEFITREVGALPAVSSVETVPVARKVKLAGSVMHGDLLPEPV
ncbi:MAG TPA: AsnC family transcriptional regulator [Solirubrobacterales bacterium]|jgi:DNA-binding Lrp family transcriptional regulator